MNGTVKPLIAEAAQNPKVQGIVAAYTVSLGAILDWIPDSIGKLATLVGIVLSIMLIRVQTQNYRKAKLEADAKEIENQILKKQLEEKQ